MIKVCKNLYQGNETDAIEAASGKDIDVIVYIGQDLPDKLSYNCKPPVVHIPMVDGDNDELTIHLALLNISYSVLDDKTLVACRAGISRSPLLVAAYLAVYESDKYTFDKALNRVRKLNPTFQPEQNLLQAVRKVCKSYFKGEQNG